MKGLYIKDLRYLMTQWKLFLLMLVILALISMDNGSTYFTVSYLSFVGVFIVFSTVTADATVDNGLRMLFALPVRRKDYVLEKYSFGLLFLSLLWVIGFCLSYLIGAARGDTVSAYDIFTTSFPLLPLLSVMLSVMLLLEFRFPNYGRLAMLIGFGFLAGIAVFVNHLAQTDIANAFSSLTTYLSAHLMTFDLFCLAGSLLILCISAIISIRIMEHREF